MRLGEFFPTRLSSPSFPSYLHGLPGLTLPARPNHFISRKISPRLVWLVTSSKTFSTPAFNSAFRAQGDIASPAIRCFWWASCESTPSLRPERKILGRGGNKTWIFSQEKLGKIAVTSLILCSHESFSFLQTSHFGEKKSAKKDVPVEEICSSFFVCAQNALTPKTADWYTGGAKDWNDPISEDLTILSLSPFLEVENKFSKFV